MILVRLLQVKTRRKDFWAWSKDMHDPMLDVGFGVWFICLVLFRRP